MIFHPISTWFCLWAIFWRCLSICMQKLNKLFSADLLLFTTDFSTFSEIRIYGQEKINTAVPSNCSGGRLKDNQDTKLCRISSPISVQVTRELQGCSFYQSFLYPNKAFPFILVSPPHPFFFFKEVYKPNFLVIHLNITVAVLSSPPANTLFLW